ncbi:uncharacterized HTH-type transcriptional regulator in the TAR-I ttuE-ttuC' intergenic region-like [Saccostrea echinata]|uniref:uncharacterized HTH-type transcriptional regulator in the TAR-I ttuE-ttuC' intergenic region-like n=1 Tax=Saccostrea echinata TaxID=191078 RepID=UPI002A818D1E|nr:uncharacterized HTH-type transcriptional regulator in the TAR-I ttuE-ttuC' intergenic region-like [Saccostrea echinata]
MPHEITTQEADKNLYVYRILREQILVGSIPPGTKIKQNELAQKLAVSRTPLINALHKLESDGLVDKVPNVGFFVHKMSIKELLNVFALSVGLHVAVMSQLREKDIQDSDVEALKATMLHYTQLGPGEEIDSYEYQKSNCQFHERLLQLGSNQLISRINEQFQVFNRVSLGGLLRPPAETLPEHMAMVQALEQRQLDDLCLLAWEHERKSCQVIAELMEKLQNLNLQVDELYVCDFFPAPAATGEAAPGRS